MCTVTFIDPCEVVVGGLPNLRDWCIPSSHIYHIFFIKLKSWYVFRKFPLIHVYVCLYSIPKKKVIQKKNFSTGNKVLKNTKNPFVPPFYVFSFAFLSFPWPYGSNNSKRLLICNPNLRIPQGPRRAPRRKFCRPLASIAYLMHIIITIVNSIQFFWCLTMVGPVMLLLLLLFLLAGVVIHLPSRPGLFFCNHAVPFCSSPAKH